MEAGMPDIAVVTNTEKIDKKDAQRLRQSLAAAGMKDPLWIEVKKGSESKAAAAKALKHGAETVVVCGGDGSVRAASEALVGANTARDVGPGGTANGIASCLGVP